MAKWSVPNQKQNNMIETLLNEFTTGDTADVFVTTVLYYTFRQAVEASKEILAREGNLSDTAEQDLQDYLSFMTSLLVVLSWFSEEKFEEEQEEFSMLCTEAIARSLEKYIDLEDIQ